MVVIAKACPRNWGSRVEGSFYDCTKLHYGGERPSVAPSFTRFLVAIETGTQLGNDYTITLVVMKVSLKVITPQAKFNFQQHVHMP